MFNISTVFNCLKECYTFIDYREALFKENGTDKTIISIFRFSNKSYEEIDSIHNDLRSKADNTNHFKLNFKILDLEDWVTQWNILKNQIDEIDNNIDIDSINPSRNRKYSSTAWISDVDREYNSLQFNVILNSGSKHHQRFQFMEGHQEIRSKRIESIYIIIRQIYRLRVMMFFEFLRHTFIK